MGAEVIVGQSTEELSPKKPGVISLPVIYAISDSPNLSVEQRQGLFSVLGVTEYTGGKINELYIIPRPGMRTPVSSNTKLQ